MANALMVLLGVIGGFLGFFFGAFIGFGAAMIGGSAGLIVGAAIGDTVQTKDQSSTDEVQELQERVGELEKSSKGKRTRETARKFNQRSVLAGVAGRLRFDEAQSEPRTITQVVSEGKQSDSFRGMMDVMGLNHFTILSCECSRSTAVSL